MLRLLRTTSSCTVSLVRPSLSAPALVDCDRRRLLSTRPDVSATGANLRTMQVANKTYDTDAWTNVTPKISSYIGRNIYMQRNHPISIVRQQIVNYFYRAFVNGKGNPLFSVFDGLHPVVGVQQNFDQLLIPADHVSRAKSDCYYVNQHQLLRAHTTAHQVCYARACAPAHIYVM